MAGQKESVSYLLELAKPYHLGHGTSYSKKAASFNKLSLPKELRGELTPIIANTDINYDNIIPYNYNIYKQISFFKKIISSSTALFPILNYQGAHLQGANL